MRELQALLKEKYFVDLINNYDHRSNIFNASNLRYKLNDISTIDNNMFLFNNNNLKLTPFNKSVSFTDSIISPNQILVNVNYTLLTTYNSFSDYLNQYLCFNTSVATSVFTKTLYLVKQLIKGSYESLICTCETVVTFKPDLFNLFVKRIIETNNNVLSIYFYTKPVISDLVLNNPISLLLESYSLKSNHFTTNYIKNQIVTSDTENTNTTLTNLEFNTSLGENVSESRFLRYTNPVFKYDYKSGDYFPKLYREVYTYLFTTINNITGGLRSAA